MEWNGMCEGCMCIFLEHIMGNPPNIFLFKFYHYMFHLLSPVNVNLI